MQSIHMCTVNYWWKTVQNTNLPCLSNTRTRPPKEYRWPTTNSTRLRSVPVWTGTWTSVKSKKALVLIILVIVFTHNKDQNTCSFSSFDRYWKLHSEYNQHVSSRLHVPQSGRRRTAASFLSSFLVRGIVQRQDVFGGFGKIQTIFHAAHHVAESLCHLPSLHFLQHNEIVVVQTSFPLRMGLFRGFRHQHRFRFVHQHRVHFRVNFRPPLLFVHRFCRWTIVFFPQPFLEIFASWKSVKSKKRLVLIILVLVFNHKINI